MSTSIESLLAPAAELRRLCQSPRHRVLFVAHAWGGGVRRHMEELAALGRERCEVVWLQPGPGGTVEVSSPTPGGALTVYFALPAEMPSLLALLRGIGLSRIHVHHLLGLPRAVLDLPALLGLPYDVTLHDYHFVCPQSQLAMGGAAYCSDPGASPCALCLPDRPAPWNLSIGQWRALFGSFFGHAARVIAPSGDVAMRYHRVWPDVPILVWPHSEAPSAPQPAVVRVVALGRLSPQKGLRVVAACAANAAELHLPLFFRILGCTTEPLIQSPLVPLSVAGEYPDAKLASLLAAEKPDVIFFPTQAPETYGYALSTALKSGVPIVASDLGAFRERLHGQQRHTMLPHGTLPAAWNDALLRAALIAPGRAIGESTAANAAPGTPPDEYAMRYFAPFEPTPPIAQPEVELDPRHLTVPRADVGEAPPTLAALFVAGVECGQLESRTELRRRIEGGKTDDAVLAEEKAQALREQVAAQRRADAAEHALRAARARIDEFEQSTSWRVTLPLRALGQRWKIMTARLLASYATARHVPRQAGIARTIWRDHGTSALIGRVWSKVNGKRRYRPPAVMRYQQEPAAGPLVFPALTAQAPRVSIIMPVHGKPLLTYTALKSVLLNTPAGRYEVIVIDDASPEPLVESLPGVTGIRVERNPVNLGFVGSCNRGAALAQGDILIFLNNDTIVTPGWLQAIVETFRRRPQAGLVGAKLVYPDGRLQEAGGIVWRDGSAWNYGRNEDPERPEFNYVREVDYCSGACLAISAVVFRTVGGFDTRYAPAYYEDTDLAFAVRAAGRKVYYQPRATVVHFEGQTAGTDTGSGVKRHQLENQRAFAQKWSATLAAHRANGIDPQLERDRLARHRVLVIDACMLTPDQDSGSVRMQAILELLMELHCKVTFVADSLEYRQPYVGDLQQRGIEVLFHPYVRSVSALLSQRGSEFDVIVLSRHYIAARHMGAVRSFAPRALLVFDTVDLHFLRAERLADLEESAVARTAARAKREEELALIRKADVTLVVSPIERTLLSQRVPDADVAILSNIHEVMPGGKPFAEREGLLFIGGFQHPPNTDAVLWYAGHVLPRVRQLLPGVTTYIIGMDAPASIRNFVAEDFMVTGHVPDIAPYFTACRVSISPLRYGAGVKGKVNLAMSYGLPVVATTPSVEGMHLTADENVVIADTAEDFAAAIARVYGDEALWHRLAEGGRESIRQNFSREVARAALTALLGRAGGRATARTSTLPMINAV